MNLVAFKPAIHLNYVRTVTDVDIGINTGGIVAHDSTGKPCAVVLLDNWTDNSVMAHITVENPLALRTLHIEAFRYIFETCGKRMIVSPVPSDNLKAKKLVTHLGFSLLAVFPDAVSDGVDLNFYRILREECAYLNTVKEVA